MTTIEVKITDKARPALKSLAKKVQNPIPGLMIAGRAAANLLKAFYRDRDKEGNKLGGDRTHYWREVGQAVNVPKPVAKDTVRVSINHPSILQKIFGGVIRAKRAGALTIPVNPAAYGRRASVLEQKLGVKLFRINSGLVAKDAAGKITVYYLLRKSVTQKPDPKALPPQAEIQRVAEEKFFAWVKS
jgi:hypothetical protein